MDIAFIACCSSTVDWARTDVLRDNGAMALLLAIHLGFVMALFLTLPFYGKFAHGDSAAALLIGSREASTLRIATRANRCRAQFP